MKTTQEIRDKKITVVIEGVGRFYLVGDVAITEHSPPAVRNPLAPEVTLPPSWKSLSVCGRVLEKELNHAKTEC